MTTEAEMEAEDGESHQKLVGPRIHREPALDTWIAVLWSPDQH
jgi:hypothetical protein